MKRKTSFFWPLVLVAVGALWLLGNLNIISAANFWALIRLWPVLLIGLGIGLVLRTRWEAAWNFVALLTIAAVFLGVVFAPQLGLTSNVIGWLNLNFERGDLRTENRTVSDFDAITIAYPADVEIKQGEVESLEIEADENIIDEIQTDVRAGRLYIDRRGWSSLFNLSAPVRVTLTVRDLNELSLSSAGEVRIDGLKTDRLDLGISGAGNLKFQDLEIGRFSCTLSGAGNIEAEGQVEDLEIRISGLGSFDGTDLESQTASVRISGAGSAGLWVQESLDASISGAGSVDYYGNPRVTKNISGAGSVNHKGDK